MSNVVSMINTDGVIAETLRKLADDFESGVVTSVILLSEQPEDGMMVCLSGHSLPEVFVILSQTMDHIKWGGMNAD